MCNKLKKIIFALSIFHTIVTLNATQDTPSQKELDSVQTVAKILEHVKGDPAVWPGYQFTNEPLIITFDNGHLYGFNIKNSTSWKTIKLQDQTVLYSPKDFWGATEAHMNPQFPIGDQKAYVFHLDMMKGNPFLPFLVLVHERFHQYQFGHFEKFDKDLDGYEDSLNPENIALMQLEERTLIEFLKALPSEKQDRLKNFMAVSKSRRGLIAASSDAWEKHQQSMEGLADYVSAKLFDTTTILPGFDGEFHLAATLQSYVDDENVAERAMKWRHYGVGAALGYALDYLHAPQWKEKIEKDNANQIEMLDQLVQLSQGEISSRLERVKQAYNYSKVLSEVKRSVKMHQQDVAAAHAEFNAMEGVSIALAMPPGQSVSGGGNSRATIQLADGSMVSIQDTSQALTGDHFWQLQFENIPVVFQKKGGNREFKLENSIEIKLDEKKYNLQDLIREGVTKSFHSINWTGKMCKFSSTNHSGRLSFEKDKLFILFDDI